MAKGQEPGVVTVALADDEKEVAGLTPEFPKYTTQIMNMACRTAQATRPRLVGQMTDLFPECDPATYEAWVEWYQRRMPTAIEDAAARVWDQVQKYNAAGNLITPEMVKLWVTDLVQTKTYAGLKKQSRILNAVGKAVGLSPVRAATKAQESKGIDGFLGTMAVSIKPHTYKTMILREKISVPIIFYEKEDGNLRIDYQQVLDAL